MGERGESRVEKLHADEFFPLGSLIGRGPAGVLTAYPGGQGWQRPERDTFSHLRHKVKVEADVEQGAEHRRGDLFGTIEMMDEGAAVALGQRPLTVDIERRGIVLVARVFDPDVLGVLLHRVQAREQEAEGH